MPRGRMLNKKISFDEVVAKLSLKSALFFSWSIAHLDVGGKILGDLNYLKGNIVPYRQDFTVKDIQKCLDELSDAGLVIVYGDTHKYLKFKGFEKNQKVNVDKEAQSEIPNPTPEQLQSNSRVTPGKVKGSISLREGKDGGVDPPPSPFSSILDVWNSFAKKNGLATIVSLSDKRIKSIDKREREKKFNLQSIFDEIEKSEFLRGKNDRGWKVDFDFVFCSANNYLKILEGKYRTNGTNRKQDRGSVDINKYIEEADTIIK
jgi:hypothetical protein